MGQITNASQFRDVQPSDWAYEALDRVVQRYGCLVGYPDGTYRGNRALSRYEFAAGLNACLRQIESLIAANGADVVSRTDFDALQRLSQEFRTELTTLGTRVDNLESRTAFIEQRQFSTTTKLSGTVIFGLTGVATGENALGEEIDNVAIFGTRTRLDLDTSFTGKDVLRTRLQALNLDAFSGTSTFTPEGDLKFAGDTFGTGNSNDIEIDALLYSFPIGEKTTVVLEANAGAPDDFTNTVNPYLDGDGDLGALSNFGTRNPIYYLVDGAGIGVQHQFSDNLELSLGYLASDPANPGEGGGLFNGPYGALAQLTIKPFDKLTLGLTYVRSYNNDLTAGSNRANLRSALLDNPNLPAALQPFAGSEVSISGNSYGLEASFELSPKFVIGGWVGYTDSRLRSGLGGAIGSGDLNIWNYALTLAFPDLGKKGSVAGIIVGMEPKVTGASDSLKFLEDKDTSLHIEGLYQYQLTDNIAITPGVIWLTAPDHNNDNDDVVIGTIRTTFSF
ncbi:MAG: iron uptake porin [Aphanothece sp. CMT-3BRIN-NPC111]|nr:iron uptake porin [Aphanothece sp. CMT-3BRIN-NPC111]